MLHTAKGVLDFMLGITSGKLQKKFTVIVWIATQNLEGGIQKDS